MEFRLRSSSPPRVVLENERDLQLLKNFNLPRESNAFSDSFLHGFS